MPAVAKGIDIVGEQRRETNLDGYQRKVTNLDTAEADAEITRPVYLPGYMTWEHAIGHHDALTDIFSLGLLLASLACGLDFTDADDLEMFASARGNLFCADHAAAPGAGGGDRGDDGTEPRTPRARTCRR